MSWWYKPVSLLVICLQTTGLVLVMRFSRTNVAGAPYLASTVVLLSELGKMAVGLCMLLAECGGSVSRCVRVFRSRIVRRPLDTAKLAVPSCLYTVQNNLLFVALTNLNAATFQLTYQLKILVTALLSRLILRRKMARLQWLSLVVLVAGVVLVQLNSDQSSSTSSPKSTETRRSAENSFAGLVAVLLACVSSGFSGVYFERLVKSSSSSQSLPVRNIQLSCFSVPLAAVAVWLTDGAAISEYGFFHGYNVYTLVIVALHTVGGIAVSVAVKYADNVLKGFATSASIVLSTALSCLLEHTQFSGGFLAGSVLVLASSVMYARASDTPPVSGRASRVASKPRR